MLSSSNNVQVSVAQLAQYGEVAEGATARKKEKLLEMPKLSSREKERLEKAKKYAVQCSYRSVLIQQAMQQQQQQVMNLKRAHGLVLGCRIYIGSISYEVREEQLREAFSPFGPVRNITLSIDPLTQTHKGFAFVEYELPEAACLALETMNGLLLGGRNIKVGRPTNMPAAAQAFEEIAREAAQYARIYLCGVHLDLSESDVQSVFQVFGSIRSVKLEPDPKAEGKHRGYGFIEYELRESAQAAILNMNMFELNGSVLRVGKAVTAPNVVLPHNRPQGPLPMGKW